MAKQGHPAYLLCLEMPEVMMMWKIIEKEYGVPMMQITEAHVQKYRVDLEQIPFYMGSKGGGAGDQLDMVEATIRAAVRRYDLRCVAFDNINFFVRSIEHATQEIARVTKRMKELAVDLNVPIIQIAQPQKFDESARMMIGSDLKDSSAIEQDSDTIMLLHRARIKTEVKDVGKSAGFVGNRSPYCLVRVDKARYAAGGECLMHFDGSRSTFRELTLGEREAMARP
jgi:replicative DNA helicase